MGLYPGDRVGGLALYVPPPTGNSLIFTAASDQYLSATGNANANQEKFTIDLWGKTSGTGSVMNLYSLVHASAGLTLELTSSGALSFFNTSGSTGFTTAATFADGNWHNFCVGVDTTQSVSSNRFQVAADGNLLTSFSSIAYPSQNFTFGTNLTVTGYIGGQSYFNGKLADFYYIDGQQLAPSSFISGSGAGACSPIRFTGSYTGVFDFFLPFSNGASTTTLGLDSSGEGNNWTLNNMTTANQSTDYP